VTSSTPSVELDGWVGLALLAGGRQRLGQRLIGTSPIHDEITELEIVSPHMLDPENARVRPESVSAPGIRFASCVADIVEIAALHAPRP